MARGEDTGRHPNRQVGRSFSKWHVLHDGETFGIHETKQDAMDEYEASKRRMGPEESKYLSIEERREDY